jgi:iron-sulfur cluster assembly protein
MEYNKTYQVLITPAAAIQVKLQLEKRGTPNSYLRLGLKGGGCSGFTYVLKFEDPPFEEKDLYFHLEGVDIVVDAKSILYLNGCILDWEQTMMKHGFKFLNPNETSKCGCGKSFNV